LLEHFGVDASPDDRLGDVGRVAQTQIAIARVLQDHLDRPRGLLVLDEPTASLPIQEVEMLLTALRSYAKAGQSILYVSHRLDEILGFTDRSSILRDGVYRGTYDSSTLDETSLAELIIGRKLAALGRERSAAPTPGDTVARLNDVAAGPLRKVDLEVRAGEILGIAGLQGSGRTELLRTLFGAQKLERGSVELFGRAVTLNEPLAAMRLGVAMVPEDRVHEASFLDMTIDENLSISVLSRYWRLGRFRWSRIRSDSRALVKRFGVKIGDISDPLSSLSGGNQQKAILARWIRRDPKLLLLDEPTQGVDVGARSDIYAIIREVAAAGAAVVVVASDLEELSLVADRVVVLNHGRITADVSGDRINAHGLTELIYGKELA
jgi:ribose transport system ATP-binding protein